MDNNNSTLDELVNFPVKVKAFGKEYQIKRLSLGPMTRAMEHIAPLGYLMRSASQSDVSDLLVNALAIAGQPALGLLSVALEEPIEWLEEQDPIEAYEALSFVVEKNAKYFFDSANRERIKVANARIGAVISKEFGATATSSPVVDTAHSQ